MKKSILLLCLAFTGIQYASAQDCNCMLEIDETFAIVPMSQGMAPDYRNDDGFSDEMALPFSFDFYGTAQNEPNGTGVYLYTIKTNKGTFSGRFVN